LNTNTVEYFAILVLPSHFATQLLQPIFGRFRCFPTTVFVECTIRRAVYCRIIEGYPLRPTIISTESVLFGYIASFLIGQVHYCLL